MTIAQQLAQALAWQKAGETDKAVAAYRAVLAAEPGNLMAGNNLGQIYIDNGRDAEAEQLFLRALAASPDSAALHVNLGVARQRQSKLGQAIASFEAALQREPDNIAALNSLAGTLMSQGRAREALARYRYALDRSQGSGAFGAALHHNYLLILHYERLLDPAAMLAEHRAWGARQAHVVRPHHANARDTERRLRIGYVSPDFGYHPVAYFIGAVLARHDRANVEIHCYSAGPRGDAMTQRLRDIGHAWHDIGRLDDEAAAAAIVADGIDVLVDLAGHTSGNRLALMARKPAPVQMTYLGYPDTTGLAAIDYRLTDAEADPPGAERFASERLIHLPGGFLAYQPAADAPGVESPPSAASGRVTFGSFNNLAKVSEESVALWSRVLDAVPRSRLVLKSRVLEDADTRAYVTARFAEAGVVSDRLELLGYTKSRAGQLAAYGQLDVALDPTPYNGTTTSCEALWMGVPVVTLAGDRHAARVGTSILRAAGLPECVAAGPEQYVAIAAGLAGDPARLARLRQSLRERLQRSPLLDSTRLARALEAAYRAAWRRWCATDPLA